MLGLGEFELYSRPTTFKIRLCVHAATVQQYAYTLKASSQFNYVAFLMKLWSSLFWNLYWKVQLLI